MLIMYLFVSLNFNDINAAPFIIHFFKFESSKKEEQKPTIGSVRFAKNVTFLGSFFPENDHILWYSAKI